MKKTIVIVATVVSLATPTAVARADQPKTAPPAASQIGPPQQEGLQALGPEIGLPCTASRMPNAYKLIVRNNRAVPIPAGTKIRASYTHWLGFVVNVITEQATVEQRLTNDLLPGQPVEINVGIIVENTGCRAWFDRGLPDLQVLEATRVSNQVKLVVRNNSAFANAGASMARVRLMKCSQILLGSVDVSVPAVPMGQTVTVFSPVTLPPGFQYFDTVVDANNAVGETNEGNNLLTGVGVCIR